MSASCFPIKLVFYLDLYSIIILKILRSSETGPWY